MNAGMIKQVVYFHGFKVENTFGFKIELYFTNKLLFWLIFNAVSFVILLKKMYPLRNIASAEFTHADYWSEAEHEVNPSIVCGAGLQECNGTCNQSLTALGIAGMQLEI